MPRYSRFLVPSLLVLMTLAVAMPLTAGGPQAEVRPWVLEHTTPGRTAEVFVVLREQADLSGASRLVDKRDRGRYVFQQLQSIAERSQAPLRKWLDKHAVSYRPYYIVNAILLRADRELVDTLASRPDVLRIEGNPHIRNQMPTPVAGPQGGQPNGVEWGIARTNAPDVWAMGFTGQGIVVGGQDTGIDWDHPALKGHYRGWDGTNADHDYNWHDAVHDAVGNSCGNDSPVPCDDYGHGTHTIGTVVGDDGAGNQIGMAPGAKWIGCRNMDNGDGTPARYLECFEFFLAPYPVGGTPAQGDPAKAPDVTNNSWGCPPSEGCSWDTLQAAVAAQRAAGIMTVVSAGNSGPGCGTVSDPPALYDDSYSVGATTSSDGLASFSSRGPASANQGNPNLLKPDIVAPGVGVRSAVPGGGYQSWQGTSMAGPHVAGAVALVWSADATLKNDQTATETLLNASAFRLASVVEGCGGDYVNGPNNSWGYGLVDVKQALTEDVTLQATAVAIAETSGNGNGVLEPGEVFSLDPTWFNPGSFTVPAVTGTAAVGTGINPGSSTANYGNIPGGESRSCLFMGDCYSAFVASSRPTGHVDRVVTETLSTGESHDWVLHIGESFADVPASHWAYSYVEKIFHNGVTVGWNGDDYAPTLPVKRWHMALFIGRALTGQQTFPVTGTVPGLGDYDCSPGGISVFTDVSPTDSMCTAVHYIASQQITLGCRPGEYCPYQPVRRYQMALFLARAMTGQLTFPQTGTVPGMGDYDCSPGGQSVFADIDPTYPHCAAIHYIAANQVTVGCGGGNYCPNDVVPRGQMAAFLVRAFDLKLYQP